MENQRLRDDRSTGKTRKDLQTQVDSLNWELQSREPSATRRESCSGGARGPWSRESVRAEVAEKTWSIEALELSEATEAGRRASEAEERVAELSARMSAANLCDDETTAGGGRSGATVAQLEEALQATKGRVHELERKLTLAEDENRAAGADRVAAVQRAELEWVV